MTLITDAGLSHLAGLPELRTLLLRVTGVTDKGLKELAACKQLRDLALDMTKVTKVGVAELKKALPNCEIRVFDQ